MAHVLPSDVVRFYSYMRESEWLHQQTFFDMKAAGHPFDVLQYGQGVNFSGFDMGGDQMHSGAAELPLHREPPRPLFLQPRHGSGHLGPKCIGLR
eukprot:8529517-Pyramimonas_sp.AAC.1